MRQPPTWLRAVRLAMAVLAMSAGFPQEAAADRPVVHQRPITHDVYDGWNSIQGTRISRDGGWLVYALVPQDGDGTLVARHLKTDVEHRHPRGGSPLITADGRHVVFTIAPPKAAVDGARKEKKKPEDWPKAGLGIMDLATGRVVTVDRVRSFSVPDHSSRFVAYLLEPEEEAAPAGQEAAPAAEGVDETRKARKKDAGSTLIVRELDGGAETAIDEVAAYVWNPDGSWLAYGVSSTDAARDGAFARRMSDGAVRALLGGRGHYKGFAFDEQGGQLAFLSDRDDYESHRSTFRLYHWTATRKGDAQLFAGDAEKVSVPFSRGEAVELAAAGTPGILDGMAPSEHGTLQFSKDGSKLFFSSAPMPPAERDEDAEPLKVDIWHWRDAELQPMQKVRADAERKRTFQAVVHLRDGRVVQIASRDMPVVRLPEAGGQVLGSSDGAYRHLMSWDASYSDVYAVNLEDGRRQRILDKSYFGATLSPGGAYALYFDDRDAHWYARRLSDGRVSNLTHGLPVSFELETWDTPNQPRPYGVAGWTEEDRSVLLYDRYDIWEVQPDGTGARMVTAGMGREQQIVFRYRALAADQRAIPAGRTLLLAAIDDRTKASGFYRVRLKGSARPEPVVMLDKAFGAPIKARDADVLVYTLSRFEEFPNLWVSDSSFSGMRQVTDAVPQQAGFTWGRSELIEYVNADGRRLQAILTRPDDFDPSRKYPLLVYIYEQLSQNLHRYVPPAPGTSINITRYVSNGYVVLQPDIVYDTGYPGASAEKCVLPAVHKVIGMGFVDPARIGIQGHSWGGYQITHLITRTNLFRAVQAGAPVANMVSAYGGIRWGTGMSRAFQYERTQSRIGGTPWTHSLRFIENSPIFWADRVQTPYLTIHNDEDDAVPWHQGIEFFSALRRLGKEAYLFNYNGEKHGLRQRDNQKHWTVHMAEYFDHYLQDAPRPEWMENGVPYLERGRRDLTDIFQPRVTTDRK
jgi:dipeptidyl aminopeptidase/acylaminoacyl peptidase